jgi:hypothetical protein
MSDDDGEALASNEGRDVPMQHFDVESGNDGFKVIDYEVVTTQALGSVDEKPVDHEKYFASGQV